MPDRHPFTVVEIDLPTCANTYGIAPCTAAIGVTGAVKCYNTIRTCQDRANFTQSTTTLRVCQGTEDVPYDAIPCLQSAHVTPGVIDPGRSIGQRGKVKVACDDFPTSDSLLDHYIADRAYVPFEQGTFWPKLRARFVSIQGAPLRVMRGEFGEDLSTFRTEHYFVESMLVDADGVDIVAKDALSFCDPKKAQCPVLSIGRLSADLSASATSFSMVPAGVGNAYYPASGILCLSGKEVLDYTRAGDTITVTGGRGNYGTDAVEHEADGVVQQVAVFNGVTAAEAVYSLLVDYTPGVEASWCDLAAWQAEADLYIGHLFQAMIAVPTSVKTLLDQVMQQAGCALWWDPVTEKIRFQTLRPVAPSATVIDRSRIVESSFRAKEQPDTRISEQWTYYGLSKPTDKGTEKTEFRAAVAQVDADSADDYGIPAYGQVLARWIGVDNRPAAERLNAMLIARFRDPPRRASLSLFVTDPQLPEMGEGILVKDMSLQDVDGSEQTVPFYVTSLEATEDKYQYELEELSFTEDALPDNSARPVFIDVDHFNVNLRTLYDTLYGNLPSGATITFTVSPRAYVGSTSPSSPSIVVGTWPVDINLRLVIASPTDADAKVLGAGGYGGGLSGGAAIPGIGGGTALYTRRAITLINYGTIGGGGGGGEPRVARAGRLPETTIPGGGGAGFNSIGPDGSRVGGQPGAASFTDYGADENAGKRRTALAGTTTTGGRGAWHELGKGGYGGDIAEGGFYKTGAPNYNSPGVAIDGASYITFEVTGTILGAQIG